MEFKDKVKTVRLKMFMSQTDFAKELGVSFATLNRWEKGHYTANFKAQKTFHEYCQKHDFKFED